MKVDKSLEEVWGWRKQLYEEYKNVPVEKRIKKLNKISETFLKKNNSKLLTRKPAVKNKKAI